MYYEWTQFNNEQPDIFKLTLTEIAFILWKYCSF